MPVATRAAEPGSGLHPPSCAVSLFGKHLRFAPLAPSVDLVWGRAGVLSPGHGAVFGLGGCAMGTHPMRGTGPRGVYGDPVPPDFTVFLKREAPPSFWLGVGMFWFAALTTMLVPGAAAFAFGGFGAAVVGDLVKRTGGAILSRTNEARDLMRLRQSELLASLRRARR